jgi:hypothetical protein
MEYPTITSVQEEIQKVRGEIRSAQTARSKSNLLSLMGDLRYLLYAKTGDEDQKRLARNCYRAAQTGFKRYE